MLEIRFKEEYGTLAVNTDMENKILIEPHVSNKVRLI